MLLENSEQGAAGSAVAAKLQPALLHKGYLQHKDKASSAQGVRLLATHISSGLVVRRTCARQWPAAGRTCCG